MWCKKPEMIKILKASAKSGFVFDPSGLKQQVGKREERNKSTSHVLR